MAEFGRSIFAHLPWLKIFLEWALAAAVMLLVLTIPAYFLYRTLTQRLRAELSRYLPFLDKRHEQNRSRREDADRELVAQYAQDHLLRHVDATSSRLWARTKTALLQPTQEIQARLAGVAGSMEVFTRALPQVHERLQAITDAMPKDFQLITTEPSLSQATGTLRVARMALVSSGLLLAAIITVNTGFLSRIVRDLGLIPPSFKSLNLPLDYILALLITCVEMGLGILHGIFADVDLSDERGKIRIGSALAALGAAGLACVEGMFYSKIIPNRTEIITIPFIGYNLPQTDFFFCWGVILVMTLFGLGLVCYRMGARVLRGTALTNVRKQLRTFTKESAHWSGALRQAESMVTTARAAVATGQGPFADEAVERLLGELRKLLEQTPPWVSIKEQPLASTEVRHLASHAILWCLVTTTAIALSISTGIASFSRLASDTGIPVVLALGQVVLVVTAGFLMGWGETVVQGHDWQKVTAPTWARYIGLALIGTFTLAYLFLVISAYSAGIVLLWIVNLLVCLAVTAACYQLIPLLGLGRIWARRAVQLLVNTGERTYRLLVIILWLLAVLLDVIMSILASPLIAITSRRAASTSPIAYANADR